MSVLYMQVFFGFLLKPHVRPYQNFPSSSFSMPFSHPSCFLLLLFDFSSNRSVSAISLVLRLHLTDCLFSTSIRSRYGYSKPVYARDSDVSDSNSYINTKDDTEDETEDDTQPGDNETHLTAPSSDVDNETFKCLIDHDKDRDYPPEYYLSQDENFDESEFAEQDYGDDSCLLLDYIEEYFFQYTTSLFAKRPFLKRTNL